MNLHRCIVTFLQQYSRFKTLTGRMYNFKYIKKKEIRENIVSFETYPTLKIEQNLLTKFLIYRIANYIQIFTN